jgi:hypothetical protein
MSDLGGKIAAVLDGGPCRIGIESTVVDLSGDSMTILRPGSIGREELEAALGERLESGSASGSGDTRSPGMKYRHYAPAVPVRLLIGPASIPEAPSAIRRMIITMPRHIHLFPGEEIRPLDEHSLYRNLRDAELLGFDEIVIYAGDDEVPAGLLDRVRKAAGE